MVTRPSTHKRFTLIFLAVALAVMSYVRSSSAQTSGPQITSITVSNVSSNSADIGYTINPAAGSRIVYDLSAHAQASDYQFACDGNACGIPPSSATYTADVTSNVLTITGLQISTTYHFRIEAKNANGTTASADRTFATTGAGGGGASVTITDISYSCDGSQCRVGFSTNIDAIVEVRWMDNAAYQANPPADCDSYPNSTAESTAAKGLRSLLVAAPGQPKLALDTKYHYCIKATAGASQSHTNDLILQTPISSSDHTFSTGACPDGTAIGSCNKDRKYCDNNGILVTSCTSICGLICPSNSTCNQSGQCVVDPTLGTSPYQCNQASCYNKNGQLIIPAPSGCYASWPRCNANTILKVRKDRGCNLWLTCSTSLQTEPTANAPAENLCLSLAACNSLGIEGQCNKYLPQGQCSNDPLRFCSSDTDCLAGGTCNISPTENPTKTLQNITYQTPEDISHIADLSGNVIAGLDWHQQGGSNVIQGFLPWQLMRQVGGNAELKNGDFEYNPPSVSPWEVAPLAKNGDNPGSTSINIDFEDRDNSINHVLVVSPVVESALATKHCQVTTYASGAQQGKPVDCSATDSVCTAANDQCVTDTTNVKFSGAVSGTFTAAPSEYYYAEARIKSPSGNPRVRFQFGYAGYTKFNVPNGSGSTNTFVDVPVTNAWQRVTLGPLNGMSGETRFGAVCAETDPATCSTFWLDDVQIRPVLQVDTNPTFITPSCRLYPKDDSPSCDYVDQNNVVYKGWHGYCLEHDSQTGTCLSWWPVDIIKGESNVFGADTPAGYKDRAPLFMCAEAAGLNGLNEFDVSKSYTAGFDYQNFVAFSPASGNCDSAKASHFTIATCTRDESGNLLPIWFVKQGANRADAGISMDQIVSIHWNSVGQFASENPTFVVHNNDALRGSTALSPAETGTDGGHDWRIWQSVDAAANETSWIFSNVTPCQRVGLSNGGQNCVYGGIVFDSTTKLVKRYELIENDRTDGVDGTGVAEPATYQVVFDLKESCSTLVEVVDPQGDNQAFASRINSSSYQVPNLQYGSGADLPPYGGAVAPANGNALPVDWPLLPIVKPDYVTFTPPGQARGGSPYGCKGKCDALVCTTNPANTCSTPQLIDQCQHPDPTSNIQPGDCTGTGSGFNGSNLGVQKYTAADQLTTDKQYFAQERIRRIFAASFGIYAWDATSQKYVLSGAHFDSPTQVCPVQQVAGLCATVSATCNATAPVTGNGTSAQAAKDNAKSKCQQIVACDGTKAECPSSGDQLKYNDIASPTCSGSGTNFTCTASCIFDQGTNTYSKATTVTQPGGPRPVRPAYPNDFCAVPPTVSGSAFLNSPATTATIDSGSGTVGIKFNSNADADQVPLRTISIDWGDGPALSYSYTFAPRNDPSKPHIFAHPYVIGGTPSPGSSCGTDSSGRFVCAYHIKIQVQDHWNWCSDTKTDASSVKNCSTNSANWFDTGLTVKVAQ